MYGSHLTLYTEAINKLQDIPVSFNVDNFLALVWWSYRLFRVALAKLNLLFSSDIIEHSAF